MGMGVFQGMETRGCIGWFHALTSSCGGNAKMKFIYNKGSREMRVIIVSGCWVIV